MDMLVRACVRSTVCRFFAVLILLAVSSPVWAQNINPGSIDIGGGVGFNNLDGIDHDRHVSFGFSGGYNLSNRTAILGEYSFLPTGSLHGVSAQRQLFGAADRISFAYSNRISPYFIAGMGIAHSSASSSGTKVGEDGIYLAAGGGASIYAGSGWGIRPELRVEPQEYYHAGHTSGNTVVQFSMSAFYQWGGVAKNNNK